MIPSAATHRAHTNYSGFKLVNSGLGCIPGTDMEQVHGQLNTVLYPPPDQPMEAEQQKQSCQAPEQSHEHPDHSGNQQQPEEHDSPEARQQNNEDSSMQVDHQRDDTEGVSGDSEQGDMQQDLADTKTFGQQDTEPDEEEKRKEDGRKPKRSRYPITLPAITVQGQPQQKRQRTQSVDGDNEGADQRDNPEDSDVSDEPETVLERPLTQEQIEQDTALVRSMPETCLILEFLFVYRQLLQLQTAFTFNSLVQALVVSPGPGMLAQLHTELLKGMVTSKTLDERTWQHYLAHRLQFVWQHLGPAAGQPPFQAERHQEAQAYAALPVANRVQALKLLCDLRLERDDLRLATEDCLAGSSSRPAKAAAAPKPPVAQPPAGRVSRSSSATNISGMANKSEEVSLIPEALRKQPIGVDGSGNTYWWLDWCEGQVEGGLDYGSLLARETAATLPKSSSAAQLSGPADAEGKTKAGKKTRQKSPAPAPAPAAGKKGSKKKEAYQLPPQPSAGSWEIIASNIPELEAFAAKLGRSMKAADKAIVQQINGLLIPELQGRIAEQDRWKKAKERTRKMLGLDVGTAGLERTSRQRKVVNYRDDEFDKVMSAAIRRGGGSEEPPPGPRRAAQRARDAAKDSLQELAGRRGRSKAGGEDLIALDLYAPRRPREAKSKQEEQETGAASGGNEHVTDATPGGYEQETDAAPPAGNEKEAGAGPAGNAQETDAGPAGDEQFGAATAGTAAATAQNGSYNVGQQGEQPSSQEQQAMMQVDQPVS